MLSFLVLSHTIFKVVPSFICFCKNDLDVLFKVDIFAPIFGLLTRKPISQLWSSILCMTETTHSFVSYSDLLLLYVQYYNYNHITGNIEVLLWPNSVLSADCALSIKNNFAFLHICF